jgi:hypothetical protein
MLIRRPTRPIPPPKTEIARRLEHVRLLSGLPSLRSFWARLAKEWPDADGAVSYEAARNYHYDREPSVAYIARVAVVFGFRLEWLISEKGAPTEQEEQLRLADARAREVSDPMGGATLAGLLEVLPAFPLQSQLTFEYRHLSAVSIKLALALIQRGDAEVADTYRRAGHLVGECIVAPLRILQAQFPIAERRLAQAYVTAAAHAVEIVADYARTDHLYQEDEMPEVKPEQESRRAPKAAKRKRRA